MQVLSGGKPWKASWYYTNCGGHIPHDIKCGPSLKETKEVHQRGKERMIEPWRTSRVCRGGGG